MDDLLFQLAKIGWLLAEPDNLVVVVVAIISVLFLLNLNRLARKLFFIFSAMLIFLAVFPVGGWLIYPLETRFPAHPDLPDKVDGIILLGGSFLPPNSDYWGRPQTNKYADRIFQFVTLLNRYPQAKAVFTGGDASLTGDGSTESQIARELFADLGIKSDRIIYEDRARNTFENGKFSYQKIQPEDGENWIVVSSAWHLPRVVGVFCELGWRVIPYPADFYTLPNDLVTPSLHLDHHLVQLNEAIYEWGGLTAYYFSGRTSQWFPDGCH